MGALRRSRRGVLAAGIVAVAVGGAVACEPGGLSSATVAYTTDETVTKELDRQKAGVQWLSCSASYGDRGTAPPSASEDTVATVPPVIPGSPAGSPAPPSP
ncbi:hypothetical protein [Streptomyces sp. TRM68367]|uniref:hypothetical protein n=1 Tax=Streptomyces sp. TRM68367 TaxID=2758415 RepID=UPI0021D2753A|nr:hypothetical protein [Streptomyces sp. TRM68367]